MDMKKQCEVWERAFAIRGYTITAACNAAGISPNAFFRWKNGSRAPLMATVAKIDKFLDGTRPKGEKDHAQ